MAGLLGWHSIDNCDLPFLSVVQSVCMAGDRYEPERSINSRLCSPATAGTLCRETVQSLRRPLPQVPRLLY